MRIKTGSGKEYGAGLVYALTRKGKAQIMLELKGVSMGEAATLDGEKTITMINESVPGAETTYTGYMRLMSIQRTDGGVRVTLEREE